MAKWEEIEAGGFLFQKLMLKMQSNKYIRQEARTTFNYEYCIFLSNYAFVVLFTSCFLFVLSWSLIKISSYSFSVTRLGGWKKERRIFKH